VVNIDPFSLDFVALWLTNVVVCSSLILVVSVVLVWVPVYDGRIVAHHLSETGQHVVSLFELSLWYLGEGGARAWLECVCVWGGGLWLTHVVVYAEA
jgi:hypothetical protein